MAALVVVAVAPLVGFILPRTIRALESPPGDAPIAFGRMWLILTAAAALIAVVQICRST